MFTISIKPFFLRSIVRRGDRDRDGGDAMILIVVDTLTLLHLTSGDRSKFEESLRTMKCTDGDIPQKKYVKVNP